MKMQRRINFSVALILNLILGAGPVAGLPSNPERALLGDMLSTSVSRGAGNKGESARAIKTPVVSHLLAKRPTTKAAQDSSLPGQSIMTLPDGRLLKVGGFDQDGPVALALVQDSSSGGATVSSISLKRSRAWHTATILPDGKVLIVGGVGPDGQAVDTVELLNLKTNTSEAIEAARLTARVYHTATLLTDGQVLITGGLSGDGKALKSAELWDFRTRIATRLRAKLRNARYNHTAKLLADGNVLLFGGTDNSGKPVDTGEQYIPLFNRFGSSDSLPGQESEAAPGVTDSLPANGAAEVPMDTFIALRFSKPLRLESINAETVRLSGPLGEVETIIVPAEGGMLAFINPTALLLPQTSYAVSVSGPVDAHGAAVAFASVSFTTLSLDGIADLPDGEEWIPDEGNFRDDWNSHRGESPWQSLPSLQAEPGVTALAGQVLRLNGNPLPNVTLRIADQSALTDKTGRFLLKQIPAGHQVLVIDGRSANKRGKSYCMFDVGVDIQDGKTNKLGYTSWLPVEDIKHATKLDVPTRKEVVATTPRIPGLELRIPDGVVLRTHHGNPLTSLSLTPVPLDRTPFPLPEGAKLFFSPQGHGAKIESAGGGQGKGLRIVFPNISGLAPGLKVDLMTYTAERGWFSYGQGQVTEDGKQIVPDPGVEFKRLGCVQMILGNPNLAPSEGPPPGCSAKDGDPVDLFTGLFLHHQTDLTLPDTIPISLTRTYRPRDSAARIFGIGTSHSYEVFLVGDYNSYAELVLPDGGRVRFNRTSSLGIGYADGVFEHTATPTEFYKSKLTWNNALFGWDLRFKDGRLWQFKVYNIHVGPPVLVLVQDRYNNCLSIARDLNRKITRITSPNGRWMEFSYDASNRVSQIKDNIGRTVGYQYDSSGRLWKVTDPAGGVTEHTYDASHRMLTVKDARGIVHVTNEYNASGRVMKQTMADGGIYQFAYTFNGSGQVMQADVTDPRGNIRRVTFNAEGYPLTDSQAFGTSDQQTTTYVRQAGSNKVTSKTDTLGRTTTFSFNSDGNVTSITWLAGTPDAVTANYTYESTFDQLASVTDPLGHTTTYAYDSKGNVTTITNPLNHQTTITYNAAGQPISITDALGNTTQFTYDAGDLITTTDPLGRTSSRFTDSAGRILSETNSLGHTTRYGYDALDRLISTADPQGGITSFVYDANGNIRSITDARGKVTSYTYDNLDRLLTRTDPLSQVDSFEYDFNGNLTKFTDRRGKVTSLRYDRLDRLTFVGYGTMTSGGTTTYESTVSYTYDGAGCGCGGADRLTQVVDSIAGTISYTYDNLDRLASETPPQGTITYTHDAAGRQTSMTVAGQTTVNYTYDNADHLTQITKGTATVTFTYDNAGRETSITLPNGVVTEYSYDAASQPTRLTYKKGANTLGNLTYEYDAAGQTVKIGGSFARTSLPQALASATYNNANRQTAFGSQTLTYDLSGNLTSDGTNTYAWNARNELVSITGPGLTANFQYDAFGRRISKSINGNATSFLYHGLNVVQEQVGGSATANILTGDVDEIFTRTDASGTWSPLFDALGSTIALTDSAGAVQTSYTYEPFGKTSVSGSANTNPSQYTGRENDETGLYSYRARYYSPSLQRFISEDPIEFAGGWNLYAYTENSPVDNSDPLGKQTKSKGGIDFKGGRKRGGPRTGPRIDGKVPQCNENMTCEELINTIGALLVSIKNRYRWEEDNKLPLDGDHLRRVLSEEGALRNCLEIFAEKWNRGECFDCPPDERRRGYKRYKKGARKAGRPRLPDLDRQYLWRPLPPAVEELIERMRQRIGKPRYIPM